MAFLLPAEQTAGGQFGAGLGAGLAQNLPDMLDKFITEKKLQKERTRVQGLFEEIGPGKLQEKASILFTSKLSPEAQKQGLEILTKQGAIDFANKVRKGEDYSIADLIEGSSLGYIPPGLAQELARPLLQDPLQKKFLEQFFGGEQAPEEIEREAPEEEVFKEKISINGKEKPQEILSLEKPIPEKAPRVTKSGKGWAQYDDEDLTSLQFLGGDVGKGAKLELDRREKVRDTEFKKQDTVQKKREFGHKETSKYAESLRESSDNAREIIDAIKEIKRIAKTGVTGVTARNLLGSFLSSKKSFLTPAFIDQDRQSLISATKSLAGGFRELFGAKPTEREFFWYENILPNLLKDAGTNIKAAEYFGKVANYKMRSQEISDEIVAANDGYRPIDIDAQVRRRLKPELESLIKEGESISKEEFSLEKMPPPGQHTNKTIEDDEGRKYKSDGKSWRRI